MQYFSDDEDDVAEATVAVVDEEVDDSRMASELPGDSAALNDDDADDDDADEVVTTSAVPDASRTDLTDEAAAALKSMDNLTEVAEQLQIKNKQSPQASTHLPLAASSSSIFPIPSADTPMSTSGLDDVTAEEIDALLPSGPLVLPEPAADGPDLEEISREQLLEDSAVFDGASSSMIAPDGIIESDNGMDYVIGDP